MKLRSLLNVAVDVRYRITMRHLDGDYETIFLDYSVNTANEKFWKALRRREEFKKMKHYVKWVSWNHACDCLDILLYEI